MFFSRDNFMEATLMTTAPAPQLLGSWRDFSWCRILSMIRAVPKTFVYCAKTAAIRPTPFRSFPLCCGYGKIHIFDSGTWPSRSFTRVCPNSTKSRLVAWLRSSLRRETRDDCTRLCPEQKLPKTGSSIFSVSPVQLKAVLFQKTPQVRRYAVSATKPPLSSG